MICVEAYDALWMFLEKDPFFLMRHTLSQHSLSLHFAKFKSLISYMASILACHYKNMLF